MPEENLVLLRLQKRTSDENVRRSEVQVTDVIGEDLETASSELLSLIGDGIGRLSSQLIQASRERPVLR